MILLLCAYNEGSDRACAHYFVKSTKMNICPISSQNTYAVGARCFPWISTIYVLWKNENDIHLDILLFSTK